MMRLQIPKFSRARAITTTAVVGSLVAGGIWLSRMHTGAFEFPGATPVHFFGAKVPQELTKDLLAKALEEAGTATELPKEVSLKIDGQPQKVIVQYAFDANLQDAMEKQFKSYHPDYGAFVAIEATTGRVLSMVSFMGAKPLAGEVPVNLALQATFPSASTFKVVTASAAIAERNFSGETVISFSGRNHTLYKSNIMKDGGRWQRRMTLKEAFARSVNTVFGKIGAFTLGAEQMRDYASRFGFNRAIAADVPMQAGKAFISNDPWELAEAASGYTRDNTMSPLQGALIASAIVNDGTMMEPYAIQSLHRQDGTEIYTSKPKISAVAVDHVTAGQVRALMKETVVSGTSRKSFRGFFKREYANINVGGKTGSLTGDSPQGKYDWFVGYADAGGGRKIAVAALTVNRQVWRVKSSFLARLAFESYFKQPKVARSLARTVAGSAHAGQPTPAAFTGPYVLRR